MFMDACRYNSGRHFLDSGGAYGRHHEKPPIAADINPVKVEVWERNGEYDISSTIETAHFLREHLDVDFDIQNQFKEWMEDQEGDWFELGERFCREVLGLHSRFRDNVYNGENDLSQVYVWEIWSPLYADESLTVIYVHTGCDVRGGYSYPLFCRSSGEYAVPVDLCASYHVGDFRRWDGERYELDERWQAGYSSWPAGELRKDIERVFMNTVKQSSFIALLKCGAICEIHAEMPLSC